MGFEVQGGGRDLVFPHHEMTASQAHVAFDDHPFAQAYVHTGLVGLDGEKMSKSRGNLVLVSQLREQGRDPMAVRLALLAHHYREDWSWTPTTGPAPSSAWTAGGRPSRPAPTATPPRWWTPYAPRWPATSGPPPRCSPSTSGRPATGEAETVRSQPPATPCSASRSDRRSLRLADGQRELARPGGTGPRVSMLTSSVA